MSDEAEKSDPPTTTIYGRAVTFKLRGDDVRIAAFALADGGIQIEFVRADRCFPLRLSKQGAEALVVLLQEIFWHAPAIPETSAATNQEKS
jgi:hypothetical protein